MSEPNEPTEDQDAEELDVIVDRASFVHFGDIHQYHFPTTVENSPERRESVEPNNIEQQGVGFLWKVMIVLVALLVIYVGDWNGRQRQLYLEVLQEQKAMKIEIGELKSNRGVEGKIQEPKESKPNDNGVLLREFNFTHGSAENYFQLAINASQLYFHLSRFKKNEKIRAQKETLKIKFEKCYTGVVHSGAYSSQVVLQYDARFQVLNASMLLNDKSYTQCFEVADNAVKMMKNLNSADQRDTWLIGDSFLIMSQAVEKMENVSSAHELCFKAVDQYEAVNEWKFQRKERMYFQKLVKQHCFDMRNQLKYSGR